MVLLLLLCYDTAAFVVCPLLVRLSVSLSVSLPVFCCACIPHSFTHSFALRRRRAALLSSAPPCVPRFLPRLRVASRCFASLCHCQKAE
ncbi:hypothetical protein IWZ03DRAFT_384712 [Phyllosticta citriasiana]|uniref:Secreted peptide n=1 Tax=Phyllosticta citriasiana TaxID=595635 RepID=A0ABR1KE60_9PEZI